jgi:hypothetical protein
VSAVPLADARTFAARARRTRLAQRAAVAAVATAGALLLLATLRSEPRPAAYVPPESSALVVLDVSASISSDTYARITATLDRLVASDVRYGLVLFSDTAYLALPPGSPAEELRPFTRFFRLGPRTQATEPALPRSPWTDQFSAGTRISTGLVLAHATIREERLENPAVLLLSDLDDDSADLPRLVEAVLALREAGIPLRVVGLNPAPEDEAFIRRLLPRRDDLVVADASFPPGEHPQARPVAPLAAAAALLALALGALAVATGRLRWRTPA